MYTLQQFMTEYPDNDACLKTIFERKYAEWVCDCGRTKLYKVAGRPVYACACGKQINPLAGTIFAHSRAPLTSWFYVMYVMSQSKNSVSAAMVQRHLGVKYDTAWRMCYKIRELMTDDEPLEGIIEVDEAYIRAKPWRTTRKLGQASTVIGLVERGGRAKAVHIPNAQGEHLYRQIKKNVPFGTTIYTDGLPAYRELDFMYNHDSVNHTKQEWTRGEVYTQNVENLWSGMKLGIQGTHKGVSPQHLQNYLNYFSWAYSSRFSEQPFYDLLGRI